MSVKGTIKTWGPTVADAALIFLGFGLDRSDVLSAWLSDAYPVAQPILFTALGAIGGWSLARARYMKRIERIVSREQFALMRLRGLSLKELGIVKQFMTQGGEVYLKADDASVRKLADSGMVRINADTYCPPDRYPFTLDDSLRSLLVEFPDALDRAIAEAESVKSRYKDA